jgi:NACalpha-BTF3-like transcription factor
MNDRLLQCIGDHLAQRAKQLMKCKEDIEQMGEFAVYCAPAEDLGELLPHLAVIKEVARATAHRATHHYRAEMQKKRSVLGILHERVAAQFSNVLMYTQCDVESRLGLREHNDDYTLLAGLARQSARYFAYAAEAACAVTDKKLRDEIVALYTRAGDFLETNPFAKECSARKMETISCEDALHVAEQAGVRYASAARALAQGDRALHGAWMEAANATSCLVNERAVKTNKRRTRVLTAEYSPDAIERADVLAEKAEDMEKMHYICTDLCSSADEVDDRE